MKKITIIAALLISLIAHAAQAQENLGLFQVENTDYLKLENYTPGITLECYSKPSGGKHMEKILINAIGEGLIKFDTAHSPAFVLNRKCPSNVLGNNRVQTLDAKEFVAKNISLTVVAHEVQINWDAQITLGNVIDFKIIKSDMLCNSTVVKVFNGSTGIDFNKYIFSEAYNPSFTYKLQIVKDGSKLRYAVNLEGKSADEQIKVYPTNCNDKLFVDFDNEGSSYDYAITDMKGNKVQKGKFIERYNVVDIHNLVPDNYIIFIEKTDGKYTVKFTKN
jgi:hypothetical protein